MPIRSEHTAQFSVLAGVPLAVITSFHARGAARAWENVRLSIAIAVRMNRYTLLVACYLLAVAATAARQGEPRTVCVVCHGVFDREI